MRRRRIVVYDAFTMHLRCIYDGKKHYDASTLQLRSLHDASTFKSLRCIYDMSFLRCIYDTSTLSILRCIYDLLFYVQATTHLRFLYYDASTICRFYVDATTHLRSEHPCTIFCETSTFILLYIYDTSKMNCRKKVGAP